MSSLTQLDFASLLTLYRSWAEKLIDPNAFDCGGDPTCISANVPLLQNIRTGPIDPDTPQSAYTRTASDGSTQNLVVRVQIVLALFPLTFVVLRRIQYRWSILLP